MQNDKRSLFLLIDSSVDTILNALTVYIAFFFTCLVRELPHEKFFPTTTKMTITILIIVIFISFVYQIMNVYKPAVLMKHTRVVTDILRANFTALSILSIVILIFAKEGTRIFITWWLIFAFILSNAFLCFKRRLILSVSHLLRGRHYSLRKVIIIGDNTASAKAYVEQIANNSNYSVMIIGYIGDKIEEEIGCDKLGSFRDLEKLLDKHKPTDVVFAIDSYNKRHLIRLVNMCDDRCIKVYFLPVTYGFFKSSRQIEQVGNIPMINIHSTPLDNRANAFIKRMIDIVGSIILIILTSPFMLFAAIGTKISSPGPILFKQQRIGMMGKSFTMLKFRSMVVNDSQDSAWSSSGDARITKFGSFIRRTAIDELPQFFNVLAGHMSLVGPRPEIPVFVDQFRETVPLYMIKHYVRPGVTGLAQIKGLRGDTSLEDRIHEDIAYLENWSLMLDFAILLKTPFKAFNKSERYMGDVKIEPVDTNTEDLEAREDESSSVPFVTDIETESASEMVEEPADNGSQADEPHASAPDGEGKAPSENEPAAQESKVDGNGIADTDGKDAASTEPTESEARADE